MYWVLFGLWTIATVGFAAALVAGQAVLGEWCTDPDTSAVGRAQWSWTQLGRVCTWNGTEGPYETGPGMGNWVFVIALAAVGVALFLAGRWIRRTRGAGADPSRPDPTSVTTESWTG